MHCIQLLNAIKILTNCELDESLENNISIMFSFFYSPYTIYSVFFNIISLAVSKRC